ncbi:hypothetical protein THAOC_03135 [Thalassiosira oceanica]|uniref:Uncharacterized protein n=1 Tax=Thalassiosira oceanica TaxID=159749 RepID=K0T8X2_THAOC|nr:hypothetical protein THAOC_03135 [Thalassiosira oceanica]|eukprot:EJK75148.1 hypothetical protein THAOC_03135 [Thalassiosira oceanica]
MIVESSRDGSASPRPNFDSESTKHVLNTSDMLLMLFDFARQYQKLPLGVLLHALLGSFQSLAATPRFGSTHKKDDGSERPQWQGRRPIRPDARLRLRMARVPDIMASQRNALLPRASRILSPRGFGPLEHHQPPCIVVYARPRRTAARLSAPMSPRSAGEVAVIRHRAPLTPVLQTEPFQPEARLHDPDQMKIPPSPGIRRSPRPVRRPSADPVLVQPTIFASSDVAVFLSARRDEASANDTPGSQIVQLRSRDTQPTLACSSLSRLFERQLRLRECVAGQLNEGTVVS